LEAHAQASVLAVSGQEDVWLGWQQRHGQTLLAAWPAAAGTRHSAGAGAKGPRWDAWWWLPWAAPMLPAWCRWLVVRRSVRAPTDLTALGVCAPQTATLAEAVRVAGMRWTLASSVAAAKGEVGLDHYEVRRWTGWYRHITFAMWAYALLTVVRARHLQEGALPKKILGQATPHRLAACKAVRSRGSRSVCPRCAASSGGSCGRPDRPWARCSTGPRGGAGTREWHNLIMTNGVQFHNYNCSSRAYPSRLFDGILRAKILSA
jgi:hypothetical protein